VLKVVWKSWGLPLTTYPFPLSPPSVYHPTPPELGGWLIAGGGGWAPRVPPYFKPCCQRIWYGSTSFCLEGPTTPNRSVLSTGPGSEPIRLPGILQKSIHIFSVILLLDFAKIINWEINLYLKATYSGRTWVSYDMWIYIYNNWDGLRSLAMFTKILNTSVMLRNILLPETDNNGRRSMKCW